MSNALLRLLPLSAVVALAALLLTWQPAREVSAALVAFAYVALCAGIYRQRRARPAPEPAGELLIAYASQSGQARNIAERSAAQLAAAGMHAMPLALNELDPSHLARYRRGLFVVSTYGAGEAPDNAARFERQLLTSSLTLRGFEYAALALGDRNYPDFCAFGRRLDRRLQAAQASPLFDRIEVDRGEPGALRHWQQRLAHLGGQQEFSDWQPTPYRRWQLQRRQCLNPGSAGAPVYLLTLLPLDGEDRWQAGDIAEVGPRHAMETVRAWLRRAGLAADQPLPDGRTIADALGDRRLPPAGSANPDIASLLALPPLAPRSYSIASIGTGGALQLLVREARAPDGHLGLGSGWLCRYAPLGSEIALRVRANPAFHGPSADTPLILIGNGTGIAGLRSHLQERAALPNTRNWLLFGERNGKHDFFFREELQGWLDSGHLQRLDLAFSRDQAAKLYVQHLLRDAADELRCWVDAGAAIYVCGSLEGMGAAVQQILVGVLGEQRLAVLAEQGRYCRDLY